MTARHAVDWRAFPCALGQVVMRTADGAEAWLRGALVLREDAPAAVLFVAPDARGDRAIFARPRPSTDVVWLSPVDGAALAVGREPPSALEVAGTTYARVRRLPLAVERAGEGAPDVGPSVILGEYASAAGDAALVLVAGTQAWGWTGRRLREGDFDVW
jgi:hypothetical protein